jgi:hypothetical protein
MFTPAMRATVPLSEPSLLLADRSPKLGRFGVVVMMNAKDVAAEGMNPRPREGAI